MSTGDHIMEKLDDDTYGRNEAVVYKYTLPLSDGGLHTIDMPEGGRILHLGMQGDNVCIWALVRPFHDKVERVFRIVGTGHPFDFVGHVHVGTVQYRLEHLGMEYVWHVFEQVQH